ncbi:E3 ubiquitin-protein ligase TRIM39-like isoform X3 [Labeo rohita]|uniref:E3 ubiquitin-protein ligase TRIM39-like isoform X3 n=1 Tax=Labeo rohita TaxID=84645 RepID=UPI0021E1D8D2|nr:E3 ubiquitin-protein ligase TRIM39-like isoform X3 [Labeo rohita]
MVVNCAVRGCRNRSSNGSKLRFFRVPRVRTREGEETRALCERRRATWLARLNRTTVSDGRRVCSDHFIQGKPSYLHDETNPDWAPSLKLEVFKDPHSQSKLHRYQRAQRRRAIRNKGKDVKAETLSEAAAVTQGTEQPCIVLINMGRDIKEEPLTEAAAVTQGTEQPCIVLINMGRDIKEEPLTEAAAVTQGTEQPCIALRNMGNDVKEELPEAAAVTQGTEQPYISTEESEMKPSIACDSVTCKNLKIECQTVACDANADSASLIYTNNTEAKENLKTQLKPILEKLRVLQEFQQTLHQTAEHIKMQAKCTEKQIKENFVQLYQFLSTEEAAMIKALREEEEQKSRILRRKIEKMRKEMSSLSATITAIEEEMKSADAVFLQNYDATSKRVSQCKPSDPEDISGVLINVPKYLSNLKFTVLQKMQKTVEYTPVTFDPNTAHCNLIVSDDLTSVRYSDEEQTLPDNPERFDMFACVLGSEGFDSGSHCWDVEVGDSTGWFLGVMTESAQRRNKIFSRSGVWLVGHFCGEYQAHEPPQAPALLPVKKRLQRIRVWLDWNSGKLSLIDPLTDTHIHSFTHTFTERLFPFFGVGCNISPLLILPVK